jgi:superoxide reductase
MAEIGNVYKCEVCGNIVGLLHAGAGTLSCCNQSMTLLKENSTDAAQEKHVPVIEKTSSGYTVKVGSAAHPMEKEHYIEWIELNAPGQTYLKHLNPGDTPEASFDTDAATVSARAYCNLHGFWKGAL